MLPPQPSLPPPPDGTPAPLLGLAFGGGGMKGWSHLGVLSVLEQYGLRPGVVAGSSAGALVGAYYAYGYSLAEMGEMMRSQRTTSLFSLRFDGVGLLHSDAFRAYLTGYLGDCRFEDLRVPFYVVCTDLETGKEVVLNRGPLVEAILASSAIPGIFSPVEIDGRLLVDGGLCNNVPVSALVHHGADYTVAVRLHQDYNGLNALPLRRPREAEAEERMSVSLWSERLRRTFRREHGHLPNGLEVIGRAMEIVVSQLESYRLQVHKPDVLITPPVAHVNILSFGEEKEEIYNCGVRAAEAQAPLLQEIARRMEAASRSRGEPAGA
jgi:NTE family protein